MSDALPPREAVKRLLIWHRGALGDLLLAGLALTAFCGHYSRARVVGVGHPERWGLLSGALPLDAVWSGDEASWAWLFQEEAPLPRALKERLAPFDLALVFTPELPPDWLTRFRDAGIGSVCWIPSFPQHGEEPVAALQARHLNDLGITTGAGPFRVALPPGETPELPGPGPWVAVAPGSGHPAKNWPLRHYYHLTRALAWEQGLKMAWLAGPAEGAMLPFLSGLAGAYGHALLAHLPLTRVAGALSRCRLYVGGDSGLTHLAGALGVPVLALFGPTDPRVWAPVGERVKVLTGSCPQGPCARGREIPCDAPRCLADLAPEQVREAITALVSPGTGAHPGVVKKFDSG